MKFLAAMVALALAQPVLGQTLTLGVQSVPADPARPPADAASAPQRELAFAIIVGHVEATAIQCRIPEHIYIVQVREARALLPMVFVRARLGSEMIEDAISRGRNEVAGWMPAFDCAEFPRFVANLHNWTVAADGWPPPR